MNLIVDDHLLARAMEVTGERTYSGAVNRGLRELVRQSDLDAIFQLEPGWWQGDLAEMRSDQPYEPPADLDMEKLRENARKIKAQLLQDMKGVRGLDEGRLGSWIADAPWPEGPPAVKPPPIKPPKRSRRK